MLSPWLVEDPIALSLVPLVVSICGVLGLLVSGHGYAWLHGAVTADTVLLAALNEPLSTLHVACSRTAEVMIGTLAASLLALVLAADAEAAPIPFSPGWSDLLGARWPAVRHALRAGIGVMMVPLVWSWLQLPNLSQAAVTVAAVMAVPALSNAVATDQQNIIERALHRILGCLLGGGAGLAYLALSIESFLPWLLTLTTGIWIAARVQSSRRGIGYVGTQGAVAFISTLVQDWGPPASILPGIERSAGIAGGLLILLVVSLLTAPAQPAAGHPAAPRRGRLHMVPSLDPARSNEVSGVGPGLTIARDVIRSHGGSIALGCTAGHGLLVEVALPASPSREVGQTTVTPAVCLTAIRSESSPAPAQAGCGPEAPSGGSQM